MTIQRNRIIDLVGSQKFSVGQSLAFGPPKPLLCARKSQQSLRYVYVLLILAWLCLLAACSPTHNWREVRHADVPATAMLPCKPDRAVREVAMLGPNTPAAPLHMMSCDVQGRTFAWAAWPLEGPQQGHDAVLAWQKAGWSSLRQTVAEANDAPPGWQVQPVTLAGALMAVRWQGSGVNHQGQTIQVHWLMLYSPQWVMQFAVYGPPANAELLEPMWAYIQLPPL